MYMKTEGKRREVNGEERDLDFGGNGWDDKQCRGTWIFIPDTGPEFFHPGSNPHQRIQVFLTQTTLFLSSRKNDLFIPNTDPDFFPSQIPDSDPVSRGQIGTGSRIRIRNTDDKSGGEVGSWVEEKCGR